MTLEIIETNPTGICHLGLDLEVEVDMPKRQDKRTYLEKMEHKLGTDGLPLLGDHLGGSREAVLE